jgi:hypothetical protein
MSGVILFLFHSILYSQYGNELYSQYDNETDFEETTFDWADSQTIRRLMSQKNEQMRNDNKSIDSQRLKYEMLNTTEYWPKEFANRKR